MDYEQKYKSLITEIKERMTLISAEKEKASSQVDKLSLGGRVAILQELLAFTHELKESEDERIRKGLIKGLSAMRDIHKHTTFSDDAINIDDAIAWLEKQGEHKDTIDIDKMVADYRDNPEKNNEHFGKPVNCMIRAYRQGIDDLLEKQGEQKPALSEEDEDMFLMCSDAIAAACAAGYYTTEEMHTMQNWLKSIKPNHWKPNEEPLKDLPKWKKAHEHKEFPLHLCVMDENMYPFLDTEVNEGDYYIELSDLKTLPKE